MGDADGVGHLYLTPRRGPGCDHVLGHPTCRVGRRTVHLGGILAGERTAAVTGHAAVGVHDDLAAREPGVGVGPAQLEDPGRVDEDAQPLGVEIGGQQRVDDVLDQVGAQLLLQVDPAGVLGRDQDRVDADGTTVLVDDRHLGLAVGSQVGHRRRPPHLCEPLREAVRQPDRQRHEVRRLVAGVPEHHPLVAGTLGVQHVLATLAGAQLESRVHALGDVGRLCVERHQHSAGLAVEPVRVVVVADVADRVAHERGDVDVGRGGHLARHHDESRGQQRLAGHAARGIPRAWRRGPRRRSGPPSCLGAPRSPIPR